MTFVALNVPPATVQLLAVAVAFRLVRAPPVITRPAPVAEPSVRARLLAVVPVPNTSLALPVAVNSSLADW